MEITELVKKTKNNLNKYEGKIYSFVSGYYGFASSGETATKFIIDRNGNFISLDDNGQVYYHHGQQVEEIPQEVDFMTVLDNTDNRCKFVEGTGKLASEYYNVVDILIHMSELAITKNIAFKTYKNGKWLIKPTSDKESE